MELPARHEAKEGRPASTDWTTIGSRILEAATLATAIHVAEMTQHDQGESAADTSAGIPNDRESCEDDWCA